MFWIEMTLIITKSGRLPEFSHWKITANKAISWQRRRWYPKLIHYDWFIQSFTRTEQFTNNWGGSELWTEPKRKLENKWNWYNHVTDQFKVYYLYIEILLTFNSYITRLKNKETRKVQHNHNLCMPTGPGEVTRSCHVCGAFYCWRINIIQALRLSSQRIRRC